MGPFLCLRRHGVSHFLHPFAPRRSDLLASLKPRRSDARHGVCCCIVFCCSVSRALPVTSGFVAGPSALPTVHFAGGSGMPPTSFSRTSPNYMAELFADPDELRFAFASCSRASKSWLKSPSSMLWPPSTNRPSTIAPSERLVLRALRSL